LGDLLAVMSESEGQPLCETFRQNFSRLVEQLAGGKPEVFSTLMKYTAQNSLSTGTQFGVNMMGGDAQKQTEEPPVFSWRGIVSWLSGACMPRPDALLELCCRFQVLPSELLLRRPLVWVIDGDLREAAETRRNRGAWRHQPEQMRKVLRAALIEHPAPNLCEVARRLDYRTCAPLRRLDAECCERILVNYRRRRMPLRDKWTVQDRACEQREIARILADSLAQDKPVPVAQISDQLGYETPNRLYRYFPELCKAIAVKQNKNREKQREAVWQGLMAALMEEPPPSTRKLSCRLGCQDAVLRGFFPDLWNKLLEAREAWHARERHCIRAKVERIMGEMRGASVPSICRAAGIGVAFLMHRFPDLYQRIISKYIEQRDAMRLQRRDRLHEEVGRIVVALSRESITPTTERVTELLSDHVTRDWKLIQHAVDDARRKIGA
jgi:AraC-like DNA-binding protein